MQETDNTLSSISSKEPYAGIDLDAQKQLSHKRVLVIDDDPASVNLLKRLLMNSGYSVSGATSGREGLEKLDIIHPSLVILDLLIPEMSGEEILKEIRATMNIPVIILSAVNDKSAIVRMLQSGVDDYITKPFDESVLLARVQAVLRRSERRAPNRIFSFPDLRLNIDTDTYEVMYQNNRVHLTGKMFDVLAVLARNAPKVVTYPELTQKVWGENSPAVRNRLKYLVYLIRKEFLEIDPNTEIFENIDRLGYRLCSNGHNRLDEKNN